MYSVHYTFHLKTTEGKEKYNNINKHFYCFSFNLLNMALYGSATFDAETNAIFTARISLFLLTISPSFFPMFFLAV